MALTIDILNKIEFIGDNWNISSKEKGDAYLELARKNSDNIETVNVCIKLAVKYYEESNENCLCNLAQCYCIIGELTTNKAEARFFYQKSIETHIKGSKSQKYKELDFYKFYSVDEKKLDLILNTIRLANPSEFNDPIDCPIIQRNGSNTIIQDKSVFDGLRIGCFGVIDYTKEINQQAFWKDAKKWAYYADKHKGICIRYRFFEDVLEKALADKFVFKRVEYKPIFSFNHGIVADGFLSKSIDYHEENEWRIVWYESGYREKYRFIQTGSNSIISIYLGSRCDKTIKKRIKDFVKEKNNKIKVYQIHPNPENLFEMIKTEVSIS